ncbi:MAG: hypothetical protein AABP62_04450 [Planctomycetota bacterium]
MNIGGVGDIGFAGMTAGLAVGAPNSMSGLSTSPGVADAASLSAVSTGRMDQLVQLMNGFSTSEILVALMLANAFSPHPRRTPAVGDSGMGSLLGLALMGQMAGQPTGLLASANPEASPMQLPLIGTQLNVQA